MVIAPNLNPSQVEVNFLVKMLIHRKHLLLRKENSQEARISKRKKKTIKVKRIKIKLTKTTRIYRPMVWLNSKK